MGGSAVFQTCPKCSRECTTDTPVCPRCRHRYCIEPAPEPGPELAPPKLSTGSIQLAVMGVGLAISLVVTGMIVMLGGRESQLNVINVLYGLLFIVIGLGL